MEQIMIKCNVGPRERVARFLIGIAGAVGALRARRPETKALLGVVGVSGLATAATKYCPMNQMLGIDRCQAAYRAFPHLLRRL